MDVHSPDSRTPASRHRSYCAGQVRRYDRDRYLTALYAPDARRAALFALYAFNLEIAKTRETVSEPMIGQIRLQWWREAVEGIYEGKTRQHEVCQALSRAVGEGELSRPYLDRMIDAREFDLTDEAPEDLAALERYAEESSSTLMMLALQALGGAAPEALEAARRGGIALALAGLLRAVPFHARQGRIYLPGDLCREAGVRRADILKGTPPTGLSQVVAEIARAARGHLSEARRGRAAVPRGALAALLPLAIVGASLKRIERAKFDVFHPRIEPGPAARQLRLMLAVFRGSY